MLRVEEIPTSWSAGRWQKLPGGGVSAWVLLLALSGCASPPGPTSLPSDQRPTNLMNVPDAVPRIEMVRAGGANKPYQVLGRSYQPFIEDLPLFERGIASWYGPGFHGRRTSIGEVYDMYGMTAAHPTMPLPSYARVRNPANGREVVVRINDRGPFHPGRIIDLSYTAAYKLDLHRGVGPVEVRRITAADIRRGGLPDRSVSSPNDDPLGEFLSRQPRDMP